MWQVTGINHDGVFANNTSHSQLEEKNEQNRTQHVRCFYNPSGRSLARTAFEKTHRPGPWAPCHAAKLTEMTRRGSTQQIQPKRPAWVGFSSLSLLPARGPGAFAIIAPIDFSIRFSSL